MTFTDMATHLAGAAGQVVLVKHQAKPLVHALKVDKTGAPRTTCGVLVPPISRWAFLGYGTHTDLTCPTCQAAVDKARGSVAVRQVVHGLARKTVSGATEGASRPEMVCVAVEGDRYLPNLTTRGAEHTPSILKTNLNGEPVSPWCTWCGAALVATDLVKSVYVPDEPNPILDALADAGLQHTPNTVLTDIINEAFDGPTPDDRLRQHQERLLAWSIKTHPEAIEKAERYHAMPAPDTDVLVSDGPVE